MPRTERRTPCLALIVAGLGHDDEGKGSAVDHLVRHHNASLVVRYNGGPDSAHHVVVHNDPDGAFHKAHQFGSGTLAGVPTLLSRTMFVEPLGLMKETESLRGLRMPFALQSLFVDEACRIVTPLHKMIARVLEMSRGSKRFGHTGSGLTVAVRDAELFEAAAAEDAERAGGDAREDGYDSEDPDAPPPSLKGGGLSSSGRLEGTGGGPGDGRPSFDRSSSFGSSRGSSDLDAQVLRAPPKLDVGSPLCFADSADLDHFRIKLDLHHKVKFTQAEQVLEAYRKRSSDYQPRAGGGAQEGDIDPFASPGNSVNSSGALGMPPGSPDEFEEDPALYYLDPYDPAVEASMVHIIGVARSTITVAQLFRWYQNFTAENQAQIVNGKAMLADHLSRQGGCVVFEGAKGVMLDPYAGFRPFVHRTPAAFGAAERVILEAAGSPGVGGSADSNWAAAVDIRRLGVLRCYAHRHGPGPLVSEVKDGVPAGDMWREWEIHNLSNEWQGCFRVGVFDALAARYAVRAAAAMAGLHQLGVSAGFPTEGGAAAPPAGSFAGCDGLILTNVDAICAEDPATQLMCTSYEYVGDDADAAMELLECEVVPYDEAEEGVEDEDGNTVAAGHDRTPLWAKAAWWPQGPAMPCSPAVSPCYDRVKVLDIPVSVHDMRMRMEEAKVSQPPPQSSQPAPLTRVLMDCVPWRCEGGPEEDVLEELKALDLQREQAKAKFEKARFQANRGPEPAPYNDWQVWTKELMKQRPKTSDAQLRFMLRLGLRLEIPIAVVSFGETHMDKADLLHVV